MRFRKKYLRIFAGIICINRKEVEQNVWNEKKYKKRLKKELDKNRYEHTLGVMYTAGSLAMAYGYDYEKAMIAGLLHDCAKSCSRQRKRFLSVKKTIS